MVVEPRLGDQRGKRPHRLDDGLEAGPELAGAGRMLAHGGGKAVQLVDHMELGLALGAPGKAGDRAVARAHVGIDVGERLLRLDHQAAPALRGRTRTRRCRPRDGRRRHRRRCRRPGRQTPDRDGSPRGSAHRRAASFRLLCLPRLSPLVAPLRPRHKPHHFAKSMTPPIIANAGPLLSRYDAIFCDVWGVVHNGRRGLRGSRRGAGALPRRGRHGDPRLQCADPGVRRRARAGEDRRAPRRLGRHRLLRRHRARPHRREGLPAHALGGTQRARLCPLRAPARPGASRLPRPRPSSAPACGTTAPRRWRTTAALIEAGRGAEAAFRVRQSRSGGRRRHPAADRAPAPSPPSTSGWAARCSGPASRIPRPTGRRCQRAGELRGQAARSRPHPRHRRCRAHRSCRRARAGRGWPVHRRRHPQRRCCAPTARSIRRSSRPCSPRPARLRPSPR